MGFVVVINEIYFYSCIFMLSFSLLYKELMFSLILLNLIFYLFSLFLLFSLFFLFNLNNFKFLNEIKFFNNSNYILITFIFSVMSLAGIPPLTGFLGKLLIITSMFNINSYLFILLFSFINIFMIYFYFQNIRFLQKKNTVNNLRLKNYFAIIDLKVIYYTVVLNFLNVFNIFYIEDYIILLNNISSWFYLW